VSDGPEDVLGFWFPRNPSLARADVTRRVDWWFRGGADADIVARFPPLLERAARGDLDRWSRAPRSRLALIIVLDQFSRSIHRGTAGAFAQDPKAVALTLEGLDIGQYTALGSHWEKLFFALPLGHSEQLAHLDRVVELMEALIEEGPPELRWWLEFSASQSRGHRDVIRRFGRHPHRNAALGRQSTPDELEYLARGEFVHKRPAPR
jgi:uncharacterized protein (DUF924 family)